MALVKLPASTQKCSTCDRWSGKRQQFGQHVADGMQVEFDNDEPNGQCVGGPWDGNVRHPLTRCGRWIQWVTQK